MNRCFRSFLAAWRTRSSALGASLRHCVRNALLSSEFPLASRLPSIASAATVPALFGDFVGTTQLSDFPRPFVIGVCPWTSRCGLPSQLPQTDVGPPGQDRTPPSRAFLRNLPRDPRARRRDMAGPDVDLAGLAPTM